MGSFSLSATDVGRLRAIVDLCAPPTDPESGAGWAVLGLLQELVGCDLVALNGMDPTTRSHYHRQFWAFGAKGEASSSELLVSDAADGPFWNAYPSSMSCIHPDHVGGRALVMHDDFYSERQWLATQMHRDVLLDVYDEMLLTFPDGPGRTVRLLFPRGRGSAHFGDRERLALALLAPHLERLLMTIRTPPPEKEVPLTRRQREVLGLVRLGLANKQIAHQLDVSPGTVRKHLENAYGALGVQSRAAAVHAVFDPDRE